MNIKIFPSSVSGEINAPPAKSYLHRAIIAASLCNDESIINNVILSDDVKMTLQAMISLGANIFYQDNYLIIKGIKPMQFMHDTVEIDCHQSGSTLRFLIPLCSYLAKKTVFKGKDSLFTRPLGEYKRLFKENKAQFIVTNNTLTIEGALLNNEYDLSLETSSQFLTGLLFLAPLLNIKTIIKIMNLSTKSISFVKMTLEVLTDFKINYLFDNDMITIEGNQCYSGRTYECEGDYSLSAFYLLLGLLTGPICVNNLNLKSIQGDKAILDIIKKCQGNIEYAKDKIRTNQSNFTNIIYSIADCIDLGPLLTVFCLFGAGESKLLNAENLKLKESNRVGSLITELKKVNANVSYVNGTLNIKPCELSSDDIVFETYQDHRLAFALTLLALNLKTPTIIKGIECANKSYPLFLDDIKRIGINYEHI